MSQNQITSATVNKIAKLAHIPVSAAEEATLSQAFNETLEVVAHMSELDTSSVQPTHQVTGLENVWRDDVVATSRMFTQTQALANAKHTYQGYFVVPQIIDQE